MNTNRTSSIRSRLTIAFLILSIAAFITLGMFGYLDILKDTLDSERFTLSVGDFRLSLYMLASGLFIIVLVFGVAHVISVFGEKRLKRIQFIRTSNKALLIKGYQITIYVLAFIISLNVLGIDLTTFAVIGGAIGIGIGFGLQKITSNFMSGLILLFEKSVEEGDLVELSDGIYGFVRQTGARYTLIETFDSKEIMVPNEDFITSRVTNWTFSNSQGRIEIKIGVSYESDIELARELILQAAVEHPRCSKDPEPKCFLTQFGDSSVDFLLYFWIDDVTEGRLEPQSDVLRTIWKKFKEQDIVIPYPQRDIHIKSTTESASGA